MIGQSVSIFLVNVTMFTDYWNTLGLSPWHH